MILSDKNNQIIDLVNQTHEIIIKENLVLPKQSILIAISGGQDSLCLFFILLHFKKQWKWHFGILYCNHFWQTNTLQINSLIFKLSLLFLIPGYLNLPLKNIFTEQNSRSWRYEQFSRISYFFTYQSIMTGHTGTDRVETILFQLIRGTSTHGLTSLNWFRSLDKITNNYLPFKTDFLKSVKDLEKAQFFQSFPYTSKISYKPVLRINFCNDGFFKFQEKYTLSSKIISKTQGSYVKKDTYINSYKTFSSRGLNLLMNTLKNFSIRNRLSKNFSSKLLSNVILFKVLECSKVRIEFKKMGFLSPTKLIKVNNTNKQLILIKLKLLAYHFFVKSEKFNQIQNKLVKIYFISLLKKKNKFCFGTLRSVCKNSYRLKYKDKLIQSELIKKKKFRFISSQVSNQNKRSLFSGEHKSSPKFFGFYLPGQDPILGFVLEPLVFKSSSSKILIKYRKVLYWNQFKSKFLNFTSTPFNSFLVIKTSQTYKQVYFREKDFTLDSFFQPIFTQYLNQGIIIKNNIPIRKVEKLNTNIKKLEKIVPHQKVFIQKLNLPIFKKIMLFEKRKKTLFILRPFLFLTRFDLKNLSKFWDLPIYPDKTNQTLSYSRNRIRKQLLPILRFFFNSQVDRLFLQFAEISNSEQLYLGVLSTYLQDEFQNKTDYNIQLNCFALNLLPIAIQRRLLKNFLDQYSIKNIKFFHIEILLNALNFKKNEFNKFSNLQKKTNLSPFSNQFSFYTYLLTRQDKKKKLLSLFFLNKGCPEQPFRTTEERRPGFSKCCPSDNIKVSPKRKATPRSLPGAKAKFVLGCSTKNTSLEHPPGTQWRTQVSSFLSFLQLLPLAQHSRWNTKMKKQQRFFISKGCREQVQNNFRLFSTENKWFVQSTRRVLSGGHKSSPFDLTSFSSNSFLNYSYKKNLQNQKEFIGNYSKINPVMYKKIKYKKLKRDFRANSNYTKPIQFIPYSENDMTFQIITNRFYFFLLVKKYKTFFQRTISCKSRQNHESLHMLLLPEQQNGKIYKTSFFFYKQAQYQIRFWHVNQLEFCKIFFYPELGTYIINNKQVFIIRNPVLQE